MPLNKDLIDAINNRPHDDVQGYDLQVTAERPTTSELAINGDIEELRRRCKAELSPQAYDLASAWAFAADSEAGEYWAEAEVRTINLIAKHFPAFEAAIRAVYSHVEEEGQDAWPACCRWTLDSAEGDDPAA